MTLRLAGAADTPRLAHPHATRITDGFLPTLGPSVLDRLYRRIEVHEGTPSAVLVWNSSSR
jgi:hypothetical protein